MPDLDLIDKTFVYNTVNECPHCVKGIRINVLKINVEESEEDIYVNLICKCPICYKVFFAQYNYEKYFDHGGYPRYISTPIYYPAKNQLPFIESEIETLSPNFVKAFKEGVTVEQLNFIDLAGLSYRRAFEFLIKDYTILLTPEKEEEIVNDSSVSNVINNRIPKKQEFEKLREISKRVWWLGNDYAHYKKHYADKDIIDLRECIDIVKYQIVMNLRYHHQTSSIKQNK